MLRHMQVDDTVERARAEGDLPIVGFKDVCGVWLRCLRVFRRGGGLSTRCVVDCSLELHVCAIHCFLCRWRRLWGH